MRLCIPRIGQAGLGNELLPVAKAFCASAELGLQMVSPQWSRSNQKYDYRRYFPASLHDRWLALVGSLQKRRVVFTEADYRETGVLDYGKAACAFLESRGLINAESVTLYTEGMWGGFLSIWNSRPFIRSMLLKMPFTLRNYYAVARELDPSKLTVAVHMRMGNFPQPEVGIAWKPGTWNVRHPVSWFESVCGAVSDAFPGDVQYMLFTDGTAEECRSFVKRFQPIESRHQKLNVCSDLALMADADLLVCSLSSFSFWAAFLGSGHYVLFAPALQIVQSYQCIWEEDLVTDVSGNSTNSQSAWYRGVPIDYGEDLPQGLRESLTATLLRKNSRRCDLILGGGIRLSDSPSWS